MSFPEGVFEWLRRDGGDSVQSAVPALFRAYYFPMTRAMPQHGFSFDGWFRDVFSKYGEGWQNGKTRSQRRRSRLLPLLIEKHVK